MRRIAQDDGFSLMPGKNCQRMTEHLQSPTLSLRHPRRLSPTFSIGDLIEDPVLLPLSLPSHPRSPKMNAHAERFNRTLQEQFVDYQEDLLFDDLAAFNQKLADWLLAYNTVLPHHSPD